MTNEQKLDKALEQEKKRQENESVIDFDQSIESISKPPIHVKYGKEQKYWSWVCFILSLLGLSEWCYRDKIYTLPGETPQWYMNIILRKVQETRNIDFSKLSEEEIIEKLEISDNVHEDIFKRLFGDEFVETYLKDNRVSKKVLTEGLLNPVLEKWGWQPVTDTTEKKTNSGK